MQSTTLSNPQVGTLTTAIATILPAPGSGGIIVAGVTFANKTGVNQTVTFTLFNGSTDFNIAFQAPIAPNDTLVFGGENLKLILTPGFSLRALAGNNAAVDYTVSSAAFT